MRALSPLQKTVVFLLQVRGAWFTAQAAAENWKRGRSSYLDSRLGCPRLLRSLFRRANAHAEMRRKEGQ